MPENRRKANGKTISISVAIIPSITQPPQREPVFYIAGGPGGDAMGDAEFLVPTLNQTQDLVVSAQRGTLDATPALLCPEIDAFNAEAVSLVYDAPSTGVLHVAATKACHDSQAQQLEANPITVTSQYTPGGPPVKVVLDGGALVNWFVAGGRSLFATVPSAIQELVNGNPVQIAANRAALANPATERTQGYGLTYGVFCSEWIPYEPQS